MNAQELFLKPNVLVEALVDRWYAWAHLIPPAPAARNITHRHLRIMDSYICSPESHAAAVKNPAMLGGPFMDYAGDKTEEVTALRDRTKRERADLLALSQAVPDWDELFATKGAGYSHQSL